MDRTLISFEQAEGADPLPAQMKRKDLTRQLRARIWEILNISIDNDSEEGPYDLDGPVLVGNWKAVLYREYVYHRHGMADDWSNLVKYNKPYIKSVFESGDYIKFFGILQFFVRDPDFPPYLRERIAKALAECMSAYRFVDEHTFVPISSDDDALTLLKGIEVAKSEGFDGARAHLIAAAAALSSGAFADSVRESMHSVESVVRQIDGSKSSFSSLENP